MRTTVELPDDLLKRAKRFALENDVTLKDVMIQGLERVLALAGGKERRRMEVAPIRLSADSPLRRLSLEDIEKIEAEDEARHLNEVYRGR